MWWKWNKTIFKSKSINVSWINQFFGSSVGSHFGIGWLVGKHLFHIHIFIYFKPKMNSIIRPLSCYLIKDMEWKYFKISRTKLIIKINLFKVFEMLSSVTSISGQVSRPDIKTCLDFRAKCLDIKIEPCFVLI